VRLKDYQTGALDTLLTYLKVLRDEYDKRAQELSDVGKLPQATRDRVMALLGDPIATAWECGQSGRVCCFTRSLA
jgi:hypothetical protein